MIYRCVFSGLVSITYSYSTDTIKLPRPFEIGVWEALDSIIISMEILGSNSACIYFTTGNWTQFSLHPQAYMPVVKLYTCIENGKKQGWSYDLTGHFWLDITLLLNFNNTASFLAVCVGLRFPCRMVASSTLKEYDHAMAPGAFHLLSK